MRRSFAIEAGMRAGLRPHPDFPPPPNITVEAEAERRGSTLLLRYRLVGDTGGLLLAAPSAPRRTDGLWRHSCFEAFVRSAGGEAYRELNFSPSTEWAAYRFDGYRSGMAELEAQPRIVRTTHGLDAAVELGSPGTWHLGLSAVLEARNGTISYWALRHPPGRPDFHHRDCFALQLPPAG